MGLLMDMASNGSKWVYGLELASYDNKKGINKHILFHGLVFGSLRAPIFGY